MAPITRPQRAALLLPGVAVDRDVVGRVVELLAVLGGRVVDCVVEAEVVVVGRSVATRFGVAGGVVVR